MAKQVHIRVDDDIYKELSDYSVVSGQSMQDCLSVAIRQMLVKAKEEPSQDCNGYTFIDLFAGIGGMRLAFESAGGCCVYSNEWNKYSQQTYYANFGVQPDGDITKVQAESIPDHSPVSRSQSPGFRRKTVWGVLPVLRTRPRERFSLMYAVS